MPFASRGRAYRGIFSLALLGFLIVACAPLELGPRGTDTRTYGRCGVTTLEGGSPDKTRHSLTCLGVADESPGDDRPAVIIGCYTETPAIGMLRSGKAKFHSGSLIEVRYRFNQRATVEKAWFWVPEKQMAGTLSDVLIKDFLRGMAARERLTFEAGDRWAIISFTGDTTGAIDDFRSRCAALKK